MAILDNNQSNSAKYALVQPYIKSRFGGTMMLQSRVIHNVYNASHNVIEFFETYLDLIIAMCLMKHMYAVRINPNGFELRARCKKQYQFTEFINPGSLSIAVCSKAKSYNHKNHEFVLTEELFDSYLECKPIRNPNYVPKQDHWIVQILKGTWDATEPITTKTNIDEVNTSPNIIPVPIPPPEQSIMDITIDRTSIEVLSQKLFGPYQPCDINAISISNDINNYLDIQVVQYQDDGNNLYTYIPVSRKDISSQEYSYLNELRVFKTRHDNNIVSVSNNCFSQIEFIQTLEIIEADATDEQSIPDEQIESSVLPITVVPIVPSNVGADIVQTRNDMVKKYFDQHQPCLITSIDYSNVQGNLYSINMTKKGGESINILIPTSSVHERERNFFTEFQNKLIKKQFIRIINNRITFSDISDIKFFDEQVIVPTYEPIVYPDIEVDEPDEVLWRQLELVFITVDNTDDEFNLELEPLPMPKPVFKTIVRKFFYETFKNAPIDKTLTFAIQNQGRIVVLHYDDTINPKGKKILYGSPLTEFDVGIQKIMNDCATKGIKFFNSNSRLIAQAYCNQTNSIVTKEYISLV
jgi:hypothetical protein